MRFFYHFAIPKRGIVCKNHLCVFVSAWLCPCNPVCGLISACPVWPFPCLF
jgi:hypothetical protein